MLTYYILYYVVFFLYFDYIYIHNIFVVINKLLLLLIL